MKNQPRLNLHTPLWISNPAPKMWMGPTQILAILASWGFMAFAAWTIYHLSR